MSLDRRQTEIEIGAGQTESRLNRDFIEFLQKWTGPVLIIVALVVGSIAGWNYLKRQRSAAEALAWELEEAHPGSKAPCWLVWLRQAVCVEAGSEASACATRTAPRASTSERAAAA